VCIYVDGKELCWRYYLKQTLSITGLLDGDKRYPFVFANTQLGTITSPATTNNKIGTIKLEIHNVSHLDKPHILKEFVFTKTVSQKVSVIATALGEPHAALPGKVSSHECGDQLLQSFVFSVKSPLAMLYKSVTPLLAKLVVWWKSIKWYPPLFLFYYHIPSFYHFLFILGLHDGLVWSEPPFHVA
jgi:hypothetical protein